ncbi:unnamed protein product [Cunninghamella echinulata]
MGINDSNNSKAIVEEENNDLFKNNDIIKNSATKSTTENNEITKDKNMELDREKRKRKRSFKPTIPKNRKKFKVRDSPLNLVKILRAAHDRKSYADLSGKPPYISSAHRSKNYSGGKNCSDVFKF